MMKSLRTFARIYKRVDQHATLFSVVVVILLFGLFLEAYMHDFNLVYITLFFIFSLAFSAGPVGILNLGHLEAAYLSPGRLFARQEGQLPIEIVNTSATPSWAVTLRDENSSVPLEQIKAGTSKVLNLPVTPAKRGTYIHQNAYLESKYPLSTVRLVMRIKASYEGIVYPEPKGIPLKTFMQQEEAYYGEEKEFDGLRSYDGSQKLSHIHWASVAKGEMSVKVFSKETQSSKLVFDFYSAGQNDEARLSQLCLWVLECEKQNLPFTIQMPGRLLISTKENIDGILETLARY